MSGMTGPVVLLGAAGASLGLAAECIAFGLDDPRSWVPDLGGWLSDRLHPVPVLVGCFAGVAAFAVAQAFQPPLMPLGTIAFLGMAALLGAASGGVFALVGKVAPIDKVGSMTGLVGAAGGLGGFVPPLIMGWVYRGAGLVRDRPHAALRRRAGRRGVHRRQDEWPGAPLTRPANQHLYYFRPFCGCSTVSTRP